jgi:hypothetical protein
MRECCEYCWHARQRYIVLFVVVVVCEGNVRSMVIPQNVTASYSIAKGWEYRADKLGAPSGRTRQALHMCRRFS